MKDLSIIFGRHPVIDAIKSGKVFDKIIFQQGVTGEFEIEVRRLCKDHNIPMNIVPKERFNKYVKGANHQGIIGFISCIEYHRLEDVVPGIWEKGETPLIVLLDNITDVRNFGAIARSAEAAGAHAIVVPFKGAALANPDAMKTSAGALNLIPVCRENSLVNVVEWLSQNGIPTFGAALGEAKLIHELDFTGPAALLMGAEGEGINPALLRRCEATYRIPMRGQTDSFNVSVAAGIALYEVMRQRG